MTTILESILNEQEQAGVQLWAATVALSAHISVNTDGLFAAHNCIQCRLLADRVHVWRIKRDYPGEA